MSSIEVGNKIGFRSEHINTNRNGMTLLVNKLSTENWKEKFTFSFDDDVKIERIPIERC